MADSPSKRRKTSPTTSVAVDASNTPSRIPIPTQSSRGTPSRRPSFASPTKASLARHNPQLLNRPSSSGEPSVRPGSRGRDLQDVFAQALAENRGKLGDSQRPVRDGSESATTTQENDPPTEVLIAQSQDQRERATTPKTRSENVPGSGISGKPRRMSRSPSKRLERPPFEHPSQPVAMDLRDDINPFQKKGLRRSPPPGSQQSQPSQVEPPIENMIENPFKKTGLRRSPITSQTIGSVGESNPQQEARLEIKRTGLRSSPILSQPTEIVESNVQQRTRLEIQRVGLRRSPIAFQTMESVEETNAQQRARHEIRKGGLRRSPISALLIENTDIVDEANISPQIRQDTQNAGLRRSPVTSRIIQFLDQGAKDTEEPLQEPPKVRSTLRRSPIPSLPMEQAPENEVQAEQQAEAQLEAELQESAVHTDPIPAQPSPKVLSKNPSRASDYVDRPAQYFTSELLKVTSDRGQDVKSKSPKVAKAPAHSIVEMMNPFITRRYEEPELPPTPPQRGISDPVVTTPPSGIHDTPSKRARRRKALSEKQKSSPRKPKDSRPENPAHEGRSKSRERQPQKLPLQKEHSKRRRSSRFIAPVDPHAAKKRERDDLLRQLQQLQADVALANQENERIRILSESKKKSLGVAPNANELLAMLLRSTAPEPSLTSATKEVSVMKLMDAFLPFRPRRKPATSPVSDKPLPSHLPIAPDDPLPYLQAFSPLTYKSTITLMPISPPASDSSAEAVGNFMQKYVINASHPSGLFAARLAMVADSSLLAIKTIDVLRLDMSAEVELGTFIRARAEATGALSKDITVICWAMARWVEVSIQRARFWCAVEKEFGTLEARATTVQKKKKRKRQAVGEDGDNENEKGQWTRRQLLPNIGRTSMELAGDDVDLRFEWKISFDFTGEVESVLAADAKIPGDWQDLDDRGSLAKVPETFDRLVKERGPLSAVRALVGLMLV